MPKTIHPEVNTNNWADLPADILARILKHGYDLKTDLTRLRGVCPSWRSALPLEQYYPSFRSHIQVPSLADGTWRDRPLYLLETAFYLFSPINPCREGSSDSSGWVVRMGQIAPNKWRLLNPLSYHYDFYNPKANGNEYLFTDPPIVGEINLLDCRVFLLAKALTLVDDLDFNAKPISSKVVGQWDLTSSTRPLSAILVLLAPDYVARLWSRLLLLRPNDAQNQEMEWAEISEWSQEDNQDYFGDLDDIAYVNGIFFVFQVNDVCWRVRTVNPSNKTKLVLNPFACSSIFQTLSRVSLVPSKSNDCLYLVLLSSFGGEQCHCFLNRHDGASVDEFDKRKIINKLSDEILFCSNYVSFSFQSSTLLNNNILQDKNSMAIFYMFSNHVSFNKFFPEDENGLNLVKYRTYKKIISLWLTTEKDISEKSVLDFDVGKNRVLLFDVMPITEKDRVYTRLFFPPPAWVKWRCTRHNNVDINLHDLINESPFVEYLSLTYNDMYSDFEEYDDFDYGSS